MSTEAKIAEYRTAITTIALCARMIAEHDLPKLLADIEHADSVGPILDPTLWRDKHRAMEQDREILKAALPLHTLAKKMQDLFLQQVEGVAEGAEAG
jgi:hypothetical protein